MPACIRHDDIMRRQITVRHDSPELEQRLRALAAARSESVNATILHILREALGVDERLASLSRYVTWSEADAAEFDAALREQRVIDEGAWE